VYRSVDVAAICLYRFEIEATPAGKPITHAKNYRTAQVVWRAISAGPAVLPFCPDRGAVNSTAEQIGCEVGNEGKDLLLVPAYLVSPGERSGRMDWSLTSVVGRETRGYPIWIMVVRSFTQSLDQAYGFVIGHPVTH
jgi:hypothetical protein